MTMTLADLLPLTPLLIVSATAVLVMLQIGIRRSHTVTATIAVTGLLLATLAAALMMSATNQQVTPLLIIDQYSLFFTVVCCAAAMFIVILSYPYLAKLDDDKDEYYLLLVIATVGAIVMVSSNHFVSTILGVETLSMSLYGMVAYPLHTKESAQHPLEAAVKYLVLSAVSSSFMLFGMALIYAQTGTLAFSSLIDLNSNAVSLSDSYAIVGLLLLISGMAFKLSLAPFHMWTPDVYEGAPLPATTYLATIGKTAMFVLLLRFVVMTEALRYDAVVIVFSLIAVLSILAGNVLALLQNKLKRILAYSSIAHMGYLIIALIASYFAASTISIEAVTFYLLAYMIMSLGAFGVASVVSSSEKEFDLVSDYQGLFWRDPWLALIFTGMLLSLAGIPLTVGFIGKFYLFFAGVESALWALLLVLVVGSGIGLFYYLRIIYCMLLPVQTPPQFPSAAGDRLGSYAVLTILFLLLLLLGVYPAPVMTLIETVSAFI
ncbi:MAG: NADH-quinone oxidoreductase subunit N [Proteobacteria bacterium]|nr:NADH-quinone oxidoreductase subunit N [Pseudomonadota bacterium]